jgi:hypothetical protein
MQDPTRNKRQADKAAIRIFFVDKTGNPITGIVVNVVAVFSKERSEILARLQSDNAGYASTKFDRSLIENALQVKITHGAKEDTAVALSVADLLAGDDARTVLLEAVERDQSKPSPGLVAIVAPDIKDLALSPSSIGLTPHLLPGRGLCGQLMPTIMGVRRFEAFRILSNICRPEVVSCAEEVRIVRGTMLEYEVEWHPVGTALGELLNTISLAPCEQVNVAIVDWMRRESASLSQTSDVQQQAAQQMNHERLINETMQSSVKNKTLTGASGTTSGASAAIPLEAVKLDMTAAWGAGVAGGISTSTVAANTASQLSECISQASSFVASQRSSSVFQTTASEHQTYQTRTVRNYNHCHTLTLMYYQVNRNYQVVTSFKGTRDVILVKYENKDFDAQRAYCNTAILKDALLDPSLRRCFDELGDALLCCDKKSAGSDVMMDSVTLTIKLGGVFGSANQIQLILNTANGPMALPWAPVSWQSGGTYTQTFSLPGQVDPKLVTSIAVFVQGSGFGGLGSGFHAFATDIDVTYHAVGYDDPLALSAEHGQINISHAWDVQAKAELPPKQEGLNPCVAASCCSKKLLAHLNCHKRYYNSLVWLNEDPNERVMRWGCCRLGNEPFSLIEQIENEPLTVYGDFVVFAVAGSEIVDDWPIPPVSKLVTMPTAGVYSEGILGQCDSCEIIDPNRRWDWKDSPCPDNAPTVESPPPPKEGIKVSDLKADALTSLISFSAVPNPPESSIKELITTLLENADKGSAEATALLEKLLDTIKESIPKSSGLPKVPKTE